MARKVREENIPLINYLNEVKEGDVSDDQDVQRHFCSDKSFVNGIGVTVLTTDYLPPLILAEVPLAPISDDVVQKYIADGLQRTMALMAIRFYNHKFTGSIEDSEIEYQTKKIGEDGKCLKDEDGHFIWEKKVFDIKNKTYDDFPKELKKKFDTYQLRIATYQDCTMEDVSKLVRKLNNHKGMNTSQKALTWIPTYARKIKNIVQSQFYANCVPCSDANRKNGTYEQTVCESVMTIYHLDNWKKAAKATNQYLEDNSNENEFDIVKKYMERIENVCSNQFQDIFTTKDLHIWLAVFNRFNAYHIEDTNFVEFLNNFKSGLHSEKVDGKSFDDINEENRNTKDKRVVKGKIEIICALMDKYFNMEYLSDTTENTIVENKEDNNDSVETILDFVKENVSNETNDEDIALYEDCVMEYVRMDSNLYKQCEKALIALMAYACNKDEDTEFGDWIQKYTNSDETYSNSQKINYTYFKHDFDTYLDSKKGAVA